MTQAKLTFEELRVQAMLLGDKWIYNAKGHYFFSDPLEKRQRFDADTMLPISEEEAEARRENEYGYKRQADG